MEKRVLLAALLSAVFLAWYSQLVSQRYGRSEPTTLERPDGLQQPDLAADSQVTQHRQVEPPGPVDQPTGTTTAAATSNTGASANAVATAAQQTAAAGIAQAAPPADDAASQLTATQAAQFFRERRGEKAKLRELLPGFTAPAVRAGCNLAARIEIILILKEALHRIPEQCLFLAE